MEIYSVLMSVYVKEHPEWLKQSIESMLAQTIPPSEFVIVKDGPLTENLDSVITRYADAYPKLFNIVTLPDNVGLGEALAEGIKNCSNEVIFRMDSDDISAPDRCEIQLKILAENPELDIIGTGICEFEGSQHNIISRHIYPEKDEDLKLYAHKRNPFAHPSVLIKKTAVLNSGNYRKYYLFEDYDLWIRMLSNGAKAYNCPQILLYMRINSNFYKRRGGIKYLSSVVSFKTEQYKNGFFSLKEYIISVTMHIIVCIIPNKARSFIYKNFLRQK